MKFFFALTILLGGTNARLMDRALGEVPDAQMEATEVDSELLQMLLDAEGSRQTIDASKCVMLSKTAIACGACTETSEATELYEAAMAGKGFGGLFKEEKASAVGESDCDIVIKPNRDGGERLLSSDYPCGGYNNDNNHVFSHAILLKDMADMWARALEFGDDDVDEGQYDSPYKSRSANLSPANNNEYNWFGIRGEAGCKSGAECKAVVEVECTNIFVKTRTSYGESVTGKCLPNCNMEWDY